MLDGVFASLVWQDKILGNTLQDYLTGILVFLFLIAGFWVFHLIVLWRLRKATKRTKTQIDDTVIKIVEDIRPPLYSLVAFFIAFTFLEVSELAESIVAGLAVAIIVYQIIRSLQIFTDYILGRYERNQIDEGSTTAIKTLGRVIKGLLWVIGLLLVLQNIGIDVTSLVAGLGIGGIAVALAAQSILGDMFSSFAIVFDKPFVQGDFIVVGEHMGVVEKVGIKTTRIRALQGEEIIISNNELTNSRIQNFKRMQKRRIQFSFGVTYDTPQEKIKKIPEVVQKMVEKSKKREFDRAHFKEFGDSSLVFEVVYNLASSDYNDYMDNQQTINLEILKVFEKEGIEMAFPTRVVYLKEK